jgi:hypothetical protein
VLAACGGGSSNPNQVSVGCPLPTGVQITLVYPANGATSVPTALPQVVLAVSSPLPSPLATAGFANLIYQQYSFSPGVGIFTVDSGTVYSVLLSENGCAPPYPTIGGFTTQ